MSNKSKTSLTIFTGPMFSAKTGSLIVQITRSRIGNLRIRVAKPAIDTRTADFIASRVIKDNGTPEIKDRINATPISTIEEFEALTAGDDYDVLVIDEAQFFPLDTPLQDSLGWFGRAIRDLLHRRKDSSLQIFIGGLDTYSDDRPFGVMPGLMALADRVEKLTAVCSKCYAQDATKSQMMRGEGPGVRIGDAETYEARCRECFEPVVG